MDISKKACALTKMNADLYQMNDRITVLEHDINGGESDLTFDSSEYFLSAIHIIYFIP